MALETISKPAAKQATSAAGGVKLKPMRIGETILRTRKYEEMRSWYRLALSAEPTVEVTVDPTAGGPRQDIARVCFFRVHVDYPFAQVLGLFEIPDLQDSAVRQPGLDHVMFRDGSLAELFQRYETLKAAGYRPTYSYNHGPGTSFYYKDPEGNLIELAAVNFADESDYLAYFRTDAYKKNFDGIQIDPEEYLARFKSGVPVEELVRIPA